MMSCSESEWTWTCFQHSVLEGTEPSDPPIRQADKYEPVINLETAKALGLTLPPD